MLSKEHFLIREGFFVTPFHFREAKLIYPYGYVFFLPYLFKMSLKPLKRIAPKKGGGEYALCRD